MPSEWYPEWIEPGLAAAGLRTAFAPLYDLGSELLDRTDILKEMLVANIAVALRKLSLGELLF